MIINTIIMSLTLLVLIITILIKNKKMVVIGCAFISLCISVITLYNEGIYADEMNLQGDISSFIIVIINVILFVILVIINQTRDDK